MIDFFNIWLPQIIGYAEIIDDGRLRAAWETGDKQAASTYYSGELDEQVFGDLQSEQIALEMAVLLKKDPALADALTSFLTAMSALIRRIEEIVDVDLWGAGTVIPREVGGIFALAEWREISDRADAVLKAASLAGFSSTDFKPS